MDEKTKLYSPGWKLVAWALITLVLPTLAISMWMTTLPERIWTSMERRIRALHQEAVARSGKRPVLRGPSLPGRAWDKYDEALTLTAKGPPIGASPAPNDESLLKAHRLALERFKEGVLTGDGQRYRDWEHPESPKRTEVLIFLGTMEMNALEKTGNAGEALERALDLLQFSNDAGRNGSREDTEEADRHRSSILELLKTRLLTRSLEKKDLAFAARALELADASFPSLRDSLVNSAMDQGFMFLDTMNQGTLLDKSQEKPTWRHLWSERIMIVRAFDATLTCMRRLAEADEEPWVKAQRLAEEAIAEANRLENPVMKRRSTWLSSMPALLRSSRVQRAQLRLLRMTAHYRATGEILSLEDPFGSKLRSSTVGNRVKFWSIGPDGQDDGGTGEWDSGKGKDIVIELNR